MAQDSGSIPDEEWERFLREAGAGTQGQDVPEEPSARARMVARRLKEQPGPPPGWRTYEPARRQRRQRRVKVWYTVGALVAVVLLVVGLAPERVAGWLADARDGSTPLAAESIRPSEPPATAVAARQPTLDEPFAGSPAERWEEGTAGIHLPSARATGWMSKAQVQRALAASRDFLAASNLDPAVLRGERPDKAIALLNPRQRDVQDYLAAAFRAPGEEDDPLKLFSRFTPQVRLVGDAVRTRGRITYREGERGALEVTTDVTYVYPVVRADGPGDEVVRTIVRREVVMSWDDPAKVETEPGTATLLSYRIDSTNGGCDTSGDGYFDPPFGAERAAPEPGGGPTVDPYDRSDSMDSRMRGAGDAGCGTATRS